MAMFDFPHATHHAILQKADFWGLPFDTCFLGGTVILSDVGWRLTLVESPLVAGDGCNV
jgi:nitrogen fixation protein